ncbi:glycoside hydrolase family 36 protein [Echinimonas agarilytica]|uniref:Alpha-galactosidase n=1 Tax=Echinimonas agarilytica TaxID=1215918 RepID=A0AA41W6I6_9GAMM|nr:glycoside hydrolase family 36 protein [Echinimonas agarilytica]MCM2679980.1 alpha-galactosidase [Echinimonas agarilytica]
MAIWLDDSSFIHAKWKNSCRLNLKARGTEQSFEVTVLNESNASIQLNDVVIAGIHAGQWLDSTIWSDGFQMLCQWTGTLSDPIRVSRCSDNDADYRIYSEHEARFYNYMIIEQTIGEHYILLGFTSCERYSSYFQRDGDELFAVIESAGGWLEKNQRRDLPKLVYLEGKLAEVQQTFADLIVAEVGASRQSKPIQGWCSWYHYYQHITEQAIQDNTAALRGELAAFDTILIDDGYQAAMGDWLIPSNRFGHGIDQVMEDIQRQGKKTAIWMAPFIAEKNAQIVRDHPDWFIRTDDDRFVAASDVTYGGWRSTPWYLLDTSIDEACQHLEQTVRYMKQRWNISLFKLDAIYWGCLKVAHQQPMTAVEAYRKGLAAIKRGAGDAMLLGCNAPMWPSLGLIDCMRTSDDVHRELGRFKQLHLENAGRSWQNGTLWQVDPDCITLQDLNTEHHQQAASFADYQFHASSVLATAGNILLGDSVLALNKVSRERLARMLNRYKSSSASAKFKDLSFEQASLQLNATTWLYFVFDLSEIAQRTVCLKHHCEADWFDFWSGVALANNRPMFTIDIEANTAKVLCVKAC